MTDAVNNGSGLIRLTLTPSTRGFTNGQVVLANAPGIANTPGLYTIKIVDGMHIDLLGSAFAGTYGPGLGSIWVVP